MNRKKGITMIVLAAALLVSTVGMMSAEMIDGHNITFVNHTYDEGISTWYYEVTTGCAPSLSHWTICWCNESAFLNHSEGGDEGYEGNNTEMPGIKFDVGYECDDSTNAPETRIVWFKLYGDYLEGLINVSTNAGNNDAVYGAVTGPMDNDYCPGCIVPELPPSILISAGLLILVGCVAMRRKD